MAKVSFTKPGGAPSMVSTDSPPATTTAAAPAADATPATTATATAPATPATPASVSVPAVVAPPGLPAPASFFDDDSFDPGDLVLPRLNIVQKVGDLSNQYPPGALVLDGTLQLIDAPKDDKISDPVKILIIGFRPTVFPEKLEGGARGEFAKSEEEVVAKGGTLDYNEHKATGKPLYQRSATAVIALQMPESCKESSAVFGEEVDGKRFTLAFCTFKGTAYTNGARVIKSAKRMNRTFREGGYPAAWWSLSTQRRKQANNYYYVPVPKPAESSSEALRSYLKTTFGL